MAYPTPVQYAPGAQSGAPTTAHRIAAATAIMLGSNDPQAAQSWIVEVRPTAATFTLTPRGRVMGVEPTTSDIPLAWSDQTVSPGTLGNAALTGTLSSTPVIMRIPADGLTVLLDFSAVSAGTVDVRVVPVRGS